MNKLINYFKHNKIIALLLLINIITSSVSFYLSSTTKFPDADGYIAMAEGLNNGYFSSWSSFGSQYPETLRTPGYPFFLLFLKSIYNSLLFIKIIQFLLYFISLLIAFKLVQYLGNQNKLSQIIFLIFTAFNIQIPFYSGYISAETLCIFLTILYTYILIVKPKKTIKYPILLGLVGGCLFITRPSFLLFPFLLFIFMLLFNRSLLKYTTIHLMVFIISLIPFTLWNYNSHGVIKPTPIDGAMGAAHLSFWYFKLPIGYVEHFHWGNFIASDLTNPIYITNENRKKNKIKYEKEWSQLLKSQKSLLTSDDIKNYETMKMTPGIFPLYNSNFTIKRTAKLKKLLLKNIKEHPWYYTKTRVYTFFRLYFTGINKVNYQQQTNVLGKLKIIYPFLVTFICILLGLLFSLIFILIKKSSRKENFILLLFISLYQGLAYTPFTLQSRYTVPIHFCILILTSILVTKILKRNVFKDKIL